MEKETLFDKARRRSFCKNNWRVNKSSNCWFIYSIRKLSWRTIFPTWEGRALKTTRGRTQFTEEQRKFLTEQFPIEEGRGKKTDPQPAGYRKKCEESGKRRVLVCWVEKMFYRRSRWQVSSQEQQWRYEKRHRYRTKNVKVKTKSRRVQSRQRPYSRTYITRLMPFPVTFAIWLIQNRIYPIGCFAEEHLWYWHKRRWRHGKRKKPLIDRITQSIRDKPSKKMFKRALLR